MKLKVLILISLFLTQLNLKANDICPLEIFEEKLMSEEISEQLDFCYAHLVELEEILKKERLAFHNEFANKADLFLYASISSANLAIITTALSIYSINLEEKEIKQRLLTGNRELNQKEDFLRLQKFLIKNKIKTRSFNRRVFEAAGVFIGLSALFFLMDVENRKYLIPDELKKDLKIACDRKEMECEKLYIHEFFKLENAISSLRKKIEDLRKLQANHL